jgi:hypothetical protein
MIQFETLSMGGAELFEARYFTPTDVISQLTCIQVDKLVRVRRLLDRLGFLNELPERLEGMIHQQQYREAVQLYNKTISVLTRHSHVLSFHKIKVSLWRGVRWHAVCVGGVVSVIPVLMIVRMSLFSCDCLACILRKLWYQNCTLRVPIVWKVHHLVLASNLWCCLLSFFGCSRFPKSQHSVPWRPLLLHPLLFLTYIRHLYMHQRTHALQERTEQMMRELTGKVTNLLDDPTLEAIKVSCSIVLLLCFALVRWLYCLCWQRSLC